MKELPSAITGVTGITFPVWSTWISFLTGLNEIVIAVLGLGILVLTFRAKWLEVRLKQMRLQDLERKSPLPEEPD